MALALYRKYRPATFAEVVGQEHVTAPLVNAVDGGRINHAYLFSGPRGCGKTSSARILARSLNCEQGPTSTPCGVCGSCVALAPDGPGSLDVIEIDAASHGGVDDARDLRERAFFAPVNSRYKVYIVDEAHMVTTQGFNALLKVVEEPPEFLVFVFATTEPEKVLPTIRSRTHHYPFRLVPPTTLRGLLEKTCAAEGVTVEPTVFPLVVRAGGGSVRDSLSILDQLLAGAGPEGVTYKSAVGLLGVTDDALLDETIDALAAHDAPAVFRAVDRVVEAGHDPRRFATDLLDRLRDLIVLDAVPHAGGNGLLDCPPDRLDLMSQQAQAPRVGHAVADGRHRARRPHRDAGDDGAAAAAGAGLRPHAAARHRRVGGRDPPAARAARAADVDRGRARRPPGRRGPPPPAPSASPAAPPAAAPGAGRPGRARQAAAPQRPPRRAEPEPPRRHRVRPPVAAPHRAHRRPRRRPPPPPRAADDWPETVQPGSGAGRQPRAGARLPARRRPRRRVGARLPAAARADRRRGLAAHRPAGRRRRGRAPTPPRGDGRRDAPARAAESAPRPAAVSRRPSSRPTPEPAAGGELTTTDVRRVWPELLSVVKRHKRTTEALLKNAQVHQLSNGVLTLSTSSPALARRLGDDLNRDVIREALNELLGVRWRVDAVVEGAAPRPAAGGARGRAGGRPRAEAAEASELDGRAGRREPAGGDRARARRRPGAGRAVAAAGPARRPPGRQLSR